MAAEKLPLAERAAFFNQTGNLQATRGIRRTWEWLPGGRKESRQIVKLYEDGSLSIWESRWFSASYKSMGVGAFTSAVLYRDFYRYNPHIYNPNHWLFELNEIINNDPDLVLGTYTRWKLK